METLVKTSERSFQSKLIPQGESAIFANINKFINDLKVGALINELFDSPNDQEKIHQLRLIDEELNKFILQLDDLIVVDKAERKRMIEKMQNIQALIDHSIKTNVLISGMNQKMALMEADHKNAIDTFSVSMNDLTIELNNIITSDSERKIGSDVETQLCKIEYLTNESVTMRDNIVKLNLRLKEVHIEKQEQYHQLQLKTLENTKLNNMLKQRNGEIETLKKKLAEKPDDPYSAILQSMGKPPTGF